MRTLKAVLFAFLGSMLLLILTTCCQNLAEEKSVEDGSEKKENGTSKDTENASNRPLPEQSPDGTLEDEGNKQDDVILPKIAPATPVSASFILVSPSENMQSMLHSMQVEGVGDSSEFSLESKKPIINHVDEVEFQSDHEEQNHVDLPPADEPKSFQGTILMRKVDSGSREGNGNHIDALESEDPVIDIMKYEAVDKEKSIDTAPESNTVDEIVQPNLDSNFEPVERRSGEFKPNTGIETDSSKSTKEEEPAESGAGELSLKDKGILESFKDWKEKQETTGKRELPENTVVKIPVKKRVNKKTNYASSECGAKVIASNQEAENVAAILNENRDLYMLNPCSCNIWFVIELCEKVRAETIEVANFELFSSTFEKLNIYFSARYPTREWENGGLFQGRPERGIQSYNMAEEYYAKFVKVEILSHFGKEHYCPLSLVRVFGRSEVEELDDSEDVSNDHDGISEDAETSSEGGKKVPSDERHQDGTKNGNFFKSATDMVIGLVNKATKSFTGAEDGQNDVGMNGANEAIHGAKEKHDEAHRQSPSQKVVQIFDDNQENVNDTEVDLGRKNESIVIDNDSSKSEGSFSSNPKVILLEGEDMDEESDVQASSKYCVFNGEIYFKRCANPIRSFWVKYLFFHRMCPLALEASNNSTRRFDNVTSLNETKVVRSTTFTLHNTTSDLRFQTSDATERVRLHAATSTGDESSDIGIVSSRSSSDSSTSTVSSPMDVGKSKDVHHDRTIFRPSEAETTFSKEGEAAITQLIKQETREDAGSCDKKVADQPDLSQLLDVAISLKAEASRIEEKDLEGVGGRDRVASATSEAEGKPKEEKETTEDVDVLVINYNEHLREGKAEVPTGGEGIATFSEKRVEISEKQSPISENEVEFLERESKISEGEATLPEPEGKVPENEAKVSESGGEPGEKSNVDVTNVDSLKIGEIRTAELSLNGESISVAPWIQDDKAESDMPKGNSMADQHVEANEKNDEEDNQHDLTEEKIASLSSPNRSELVVENEAIVSNKGISGSKGITIQVEPSFSQPASTSLGSQTTQSGVNVEAFKANLTSDDIGTTLRPASVSRSSAGIEHLSISPTYVSEEMKPGVRQLSEKIADMKEHLSSSMEQFEMRKKEAMETLAQSESSVKIGSGSSGNNKESAILKLKSRVKELAENLTLSTLYLEEMSKRYGTALEEQQKQFKVKINQLNQTIMTNKDVIERQQKSIEELTQQVTLLSLHLQNLTEMTRDNNLKMAERYAFTCMVEGFIIIIVLYTCVRGPRVMQQAAEQRRHSAPSSYHHYVGQGAHRLLPLGDPSSMADQRPSEYSISPTLDCNVAATTTNGAIARRRRQRKKKDDCIFTELSPTDVNPAKDTAFVSKTAGVLFSAGKGIFSGLTGAFTKQKKPIASRRTRALIDSTEYKRVKSLNRSNSLPTIEEDVKPYSSHQHQNFESIRNSKCKRTVTRLDDNDKRRG